ncbi:MAG: glutamate-cysteine ligase family protein [Myxococcota bacterium]|nr:glutamate-cysteine ligase family protein [Myxococcota bacterium]
MDGARLDVTPFLERFRSGFNSRPIPLRKIGREAEYPVVDVDGRAFDIARLWPDLAGPGLKRERVDNGMIVGLNGLQYSYASEVGRGTIEVITGPRHDLIQLAKDHEAAVARLVDAAHKHGARVLGLGVQPVTVPSLELMTPKPRYTVLRDTIGDGWLTFTVTASDQTHVDVSAPEVIPMTNLCNLLSPVIIALCANSGVVAGESAGVVSWREQAMGAIQPEYGRHGMPRRPAETLAHHMEMLCELPHLMHRDGGVATPGDLRPFSAVMRGMEPEAAWNAFLVHDHYVWHSARPRSRQGTVEIRCACQQPWDSHMVVAALSLGIVSGAAEIAQYVQDTLGSDAWAIMQEWHGRVVRLGLSAPEPREGLVEGVLERARAALRARGRKEAPFIEPLFWRLQRKESPAQRFQSLAAAEGLAAAVDAASIPAAVE